MNSIPLELLLLIDLIEVGAIGEMSFACFRPAAKKFVDGEELLVQGGLVGLLPAVVFEERGQVACRDLGGSRRDCTPAIRPT